MHFIFFSNLKLIYLNLRYVYSYFLYKLLYSKEDFLKIFIFE